MLRRFKVLAIVLAFVLIVWGLVKESSRNERLQKQVAELQKKTVELQTYEPVYLEFKKRYVEMCRADGLDRCEERTVTADDVLAVLSYYAERHRAEKNE